MSQADTTKPAKAATARRAVQIAAFATCVALSGLLAVPWRDAPSATSLAVRFFAWATPTILAVVLLGRMRGANRKHVQARDVLAARSSTVNRLLEFSQTIQGAGKPEQIYPTLHHFLQSELGLAGLLIVSSEPATIPAMHVKVAWPERLLRPDMPIAEMDAALCPCLRQNLPKLFRPDCSSVRCAVDASITMPTTHPAYCIPFNIGRKAQMLVHMLLPVGGEWSEDLKQLAQTYVNAASSMLITLHHLAEAERQSMTDVLTGLYNRRSMESLLQREVALGERYGLPLSIVMIDMDEFKQINDAHGHAAGDHMLRAFADCVRITLRKTDLAFRYGGDEFVIALPQTHVSQAQAVVQKLRQAFASVDFSSAVANLRHQPTLSIGLAERSVPHNLLTLGAIMGAADAALYEAKNANRNCVKVYQPKAA
ncbi:MAG: diguanylate cyclase [Fimbriimonadales bacterium]